jgi:hypothetical protein
MKAFEVLRDLYIPGSGGAVWPTSDVKMVVNLPVTSAGGAAKLFLLCCNLVQAHGHSRQ